MDEIYYCAQVIRRISLFEKIPEKILNSLASSARPRFFEPSQIIYMEGDPAEHLYILETGWVKSTRMTLEGRQQAMLFLRPVDIFGDIALLTDTPYPATVIALEAVKVWTIPAPVFLELLQAHSELSMRVIRHLGERVLHYITMVEDLSLRSVEARLAHKLLGNVEMREGRFVVPRREWTTFDEMAVRLGTVRDVLSRALKTLEGEKLLRVEKQEIILLDLERLMQRANR